jgi:hypothetical protein
MSALVRLVLVLSVGWRNLIVSQFPGQFPGYASLAVAFVAVFFMYFEHLRK